jgi:hypothetical protein
VRALRNIAIIAALAFVVAAVPGGGNLADGVLAALTVAFLAIIAAAVYFAWRQNQFSYMTLTDRQRAILLSALGAIALMVAGADEMLGTGPGAVAWIAILGLAIFGIVRVVAEARSY